MFTPQISFVTFISFLLALFVGFLVGTERKVRATKEDRIKGAGVRSFALVSLIGFLLVRVFEGEELLISISVILFATLSLMMSLFRAKEGSRGLTTSGALLVTFLTGMIFGMEQVFFGLVSGAFLLMLLFSKRLLHGFAEILSKEDLISAVRFLIVAGILLPITYTIGPIHPLIGPGRVFDPLQGLTMVIFVSLISFLSFLAMKILGAGKGIQISSFIGGLVSSAAATASLSERSKSIEFKYAPAVGIHLSNISMFIKDFVIILVVGGVSLARLFTIPLSALILLTVVMIFLYRKKLEGSVIREGKLDLGTPFALTPAVKFGALFTFIWVSSYFLQNYLGEYGVYMVSLGGLISTTSVSASISSLYLTGEIGGLTALSTMLLAFGFGSISKVFIARAYDKELADKIMFSMMILTTISFILVVLLNL